MSFPRVSFLVAGLLAVSFNSASYATAQDHQHDHKPRKQAPRPAQRSELPPSAEQTKFNLPISKSDKQKLLTNTNRQTRLQARSDGVAMALATPDCKDMNKLATYSGTALADYVANLPDYECTYGLFSLTATQATTVYSASNMNAILSRFTQEASAYNATNIRLVNLALYLRAGFYLASGNVIPKPASTVVTSLRAPIQQLVNSSVLYQNNTAGSTTAGEVMKLITNLNDEVFYLPSMKNVLERFTNSPSNPNAANALLQDSAAGALTGALTVFFYAHSRPDVGTAMLNLAYPSALNNFVVNNKSVLLNSSAAYQLKDTENEAFRFMQYPSLLSSIKPMVKYQLSTSSMTGVDSDLWLSAATAVDFYDSANCAEYSTCGYKTQLANTVLKTSHTCSPTIKIRAQDMTTTQLQDSCNILAAEETYFHNMLVTNRTPVANDNNKVLELVVFDDYASYNKYAGAIYDIATDNGGMYLEGDPSDINNQARFIAHEASWLRPTFTVWNLEHEYVHYLDGRFNLYGDFGESIAKPTVWWLEGLGEYLSYKNNYQAAIDAAKTGSYKLSTILGNTYSMSDYVTRAYRWGYMAVRFMNERHRSDIDAILPKFRSGDYVGYQNYINAIGTRYDAEFAAWVQTATVNGEPPMPIPPVVTLPACSSSSQLGKNCSIRNLSSSTQAYIYIMLPAGAKNLKLFTNGGTGDVDLYVKKAAYPTTSSYDAASLKAGNNESVFLATPSSGTWYYIVLKAKQAFTGVNINASYE